MPFVAAPSGRVVEKYIELVKAVNESQNQAEHDANSAKLAGFREAWSMSKDDYWLGCLVAAADAYYAVQGCERPMCGGEWLDWQPTRPSAV